MNYITVLKVRKFGEDEIFSKNSFAPFSAQIWLMSKGKDLRMAGHTTRKKPASNKVKATRPLLHNTGQHTPSQL